MQYTWKSWYMVKMVYYSWRNSIFTTILLNFTHFNGVIHMLILMQLVELILLAFWCQLESIFILTITVHYWVFPTQNTKKFTEIVVNVAFIFFNLIKVTVFTLFSQNKIVRKCIEMA